MDEYVIKDHKKLRRGFTTGSCAAAAAAAALRLLLRAHGGSGEAMPDSEGAGTEHNLTEIRLITPNGTQLNIPAEIICPPGEEPGGDGNPRWSAVCAVRKDSGDDPDVTDGVMVYARVTLAPDDPERVIIEGGKGVGRVTKPGLACGVGEAAINPTPRKMIEAEMIQAARQAGYEGGIQVEISIPAGEELAKKTYNPRLGIEGGISVLGTSGIVEPMSEQALIDTIKVEMNIRKAAGAQYLLLTPGNYGETFLKQTMKLGEVYTVKCSNFLGEALDYAVELGFKGLLLVAHIGKLVKVAGGIMNTHSKYGDARMEILTAHAAMLGADRQTVLRLMSCITTDDAIQVLDGVSDQPASEKTKPRKLEGLTQESELRRQTIQAVLERIDYHIKERTRHTMETGAVMFSNQYGYLGQTAEAAQLLDKLQIRGARWDEGKEPQTPEAGENK